MNHDEHPDELRDRLRKQDPARADQPADSWIDNLVEATMSTTENPAGRKRRLPLLAAAAAVAIVAAGVGFALNRGDDDAPVAKPAGPALKLTLPSAADQAMMMCAQVTPEILGTMDVGLAGTVTKLEGGTAFVDVDRWYKGGDNDTVELAAPSADELAALEGFVDLEEGQRYLIAATAGAVNGCGFTAPYDDTLAAIYDEAF